MSKRNSVVYARPEEPKFLRQIKERIGYKEGPTIESKRIEREKRADDHYDRVDERPTVDLEHSNVGEQEALVYIEKKFEDERKETQKITFRKPIKSDNEKKNFLIQSSSLSSSSKRAADDDDRKNCATRNVQKKVLRNNEKQSANSKLLSFNDDEDDDD